MLSGSSNVESQDFADAQSLTLRDIDSDLSNLSWMSYVKSYDLLLNQLVIGLTGTR